MSQANFAPYQPPPDEKIAAARSVASSSRTPIVPSAAKESGLRASFDSDIDPQYATESYQSSTPYAVQNQRSLSSAAPTTNSYNKQNPRPTPAWSQQHLDQAPYHPALPSQSRPDHLSYSTAHGWNLSNLCFATWCLPPFSSVLLLIYETENDLVRFHSYQSGMLGVAAVLFLWFLRAILGWKTLSIIVGMAALGYFWICGSSAANSAPTMARSPYLAYVGPLAEQWVGEE